jgi:hypothetical protein
MGIFEGDLTCLQMGFLYNTNHVYINDLEDELKWSKNLDYMEIHSDGIILYGNSNTLCLGSWVYSREISPIFKWDFSITPIMFI